MSQKQNDEPLDAPTPPGGPQRTDAPAGDQTPGRPGTPGSEAVDDDRPDDRPDDRRSADPADSEEHR